FGDSPRKSGANNRFMDEIYLYCYPWFIRFLGVFHNHLWHDRSETEIFRGIPWNRPKAVFKSSILFHYFAYSSDLSSARLYMEIEIQKFNIPDYRPRMEQFQKAVRKVRAVQRLRRTRGFAFSQNESGQEAHLIRVYDTTVAKPKG
ncbi:15104_t:CDS:2, partial [Acaulospora morrowiae]